VLPSLLLTLDRKLTTKSFEEPYFDAYSEENELDWTDLQFSVADDESKISNENKKEK
jgi:hypothetical protein